MTKWHVLIPVLLFWSILNVLRPFHTSSKLWLYKTETCANQGPGGNVDYELWLFFSHNRHGEKKDDESSTFYPRNKWQMQKTENIPMTLAVALCFPRTIAFFLSKRVLPPRASQKFLSGKTLRADKGCLLCKICWPCVHNSGRERWRHFEAPLILSILIWLLANGRGHNIAKTEYINEAMSTTNCQVAARGCTYLEPST